MSTTSDPIGLIRNNIDDNSKLQTMLAIEYTALDDILKKVSNFIKKNEDSNISELDYNLLKKYFANLFENNLEDKDSISISKLSFSNIKNITKTLRGSIVKLRTDLNNDKVTFQINCRTMIMNALKSYEEFKVDGILPEKYWEDIKKLFLLLLDVKDRYSSRYCKTPFDWMCLGIDAGLLEDMVVVMRLTYMVGLPTKHLISFNELINFFSDEKTVENYKHRFLFLVDFIKNNSSEYISNHFKNLIKRQNDSIRIGIYTDKDNIDYYYSLQGLFGVPYDPLVTTILDKDNCPLYAIHFTAKPIANAIWNNKITDKKFPVGCICKADTSNARDIHGITQIFKNSDGKFEMNDNYKFIRFRMVHGLDDNITRFKYQTGLIIDLKLLVNTLPPNSVIINELTTMLCSKNIPRNCIIDILNETNINTFWGIKN
jgi:hypothetical protein